MYNDTQLDSIQNSTNKLKSTGGFDVIQRGVILWNTLEKKPYDLLKPKEWFRPLKRRMSLAKL